MEARYNRRRFCRLGALFVPAAFAVLRGHGQIVGHAPRMPLNSTVSSLLTGLVGYWTLDESSTGVSGVNRLDSSGTGLTMTDTTFTTTFCPSDTGKISRGVKPAVAGSCLLRASDANTNTGDINFTFTAWVNVNTISASNYVVSKADATNADNYIIDTSSSQFRFYIRDSGGTYKIATTTGTWLGGTWYWLCGWYDTGSGANSSGTRSVHISVDNGTDFSTAAGSSFASTGSTFQFMSYRGTAANFAGIVDEVGFWKRLLTAGEKATLYNSGTGKTYPF